MKKTFSKRFMSFLLSVMMIVTMLPAFTITTSAAQISANNDNKYVFAYFTGDGEGQKVRFALSSDGHNFSPLNGNNPYLDSTTNGEVYPNVNTDRSAMYGSTGYARDPFIIKKVNAEGYYIVATDLFVPTSYNNTKLLVWDVKDLESAPSTKPWNVETIRMFKDGVNMGKNNDAIAWAPEVVYDYSTNRYMMYWSGPTYSNTTIRCAYTNDFKSFYTKDGNLIDGVNYEPETLFTYSDHRSIDANIVYNQDDQNYYMVYKCEYSGSSSNKSNIGTLWITKAPSIAGLTGTTPTQIKLTGVDGKNQTLIFEGPELYQRNDGRWVLITDQYSQNPLWDYYMIVVDELGDLFSGQEFINKRNQSTNINDCLPRHGAVATVDTATYQNIAKSASIPADFPYTNMTSAYPNFPAESAASSIPTSYPDYCRNILYSVGNANGMSSSGGGKTEATGPTIASKSGLFGWTMAAQFGIQYANQTTVIYNGTNPCIPAMAYTHKTSNNSTAYIYNVYPTVSSSDAADNSILSIVERWKGGDGRNSEDWTDGMINGASWIGKSSTDKIHCNSISNKQWQHYSSAIEVNGANIDFNEYGGALKTISNTSWRATSATTNNENEYKNTDFNPITLTDNNTIRVLNYKPIVDAAAQIRAKYNEVMDSDLSSYCPESLDAYLAAVGKVTSDIRVYFVNGNFYEQAALFLRDIYLNGKLQLALDGPVKSRIQYGNLFDFDAYMTSSSVSVIRDAVKYYETTDGYHIGLDAKTKTVTVTGDDDSYTSMDLRIDTYKIPVTPGQKYIFEYTSDSQYANAMVFVPNDSNTSYDPNPGGINCDTFGRIGGSGTQKIEITIPAGKNYVFFRLGVTGGSEQNPVTANINRIRFYKAEYENWASRDNENIPADRLSNNCNGVAAHNDPNVPLIGFTDYGQPLAVPTHLEGKHFCGWYADEALTTPVSGSDDISGCSVLYARYSDTVHIDSTPATCTGPGKTEGDLCTFCNNKWEVEQQPIAAPGHNFIYKSKVEGSDKYEFVCEGNHEHTNLVAESGPYEYLDMIKDTLDTGRFQNKADLEAGIESFEAMKTNVVNTMKDDEAAVGNDIQKMIDDSIKSLLTAINESTYSKYNLTFNVYKNGELVHTDTQNKDYNSVVTLDASPYTDGAVCMAWNASTADSQGNIKAFGSNSNVYDVRIQSDTVVNAYFVTPDQTNVVIVTDQYTAPLYQFVADEITINGSTVTANGVDYTVPDMPYLAVKGFSISSVPVSGTVSVHGKTLVVPITEKPEDTYAITVDGQPHEKQYKYDERVKITVPSDAYAVAIKVAEGDYRVVAYGNEYTFFANRDMDFFAVYGSEGNYTINGTAVTDKKTIHKLDYKLPFVYSASKNTDADTNRYTAFNSYSVGSNAQIIEVGTLFYKGTGSNVPGEMTIDNAAISSSVSKYQAAPGNQYSLSAKGAIGSATGLTTRAYVKYSYEYNGATIVAVEYGNVCSTETLVR